MTTSCVRFVAALSVQACFPASLRALRILVICSLLPVCGVAAGPSTTLVSLPSTGINAIQVDSSGNIYIAGFQGTSGPPFAGHALVTKLSPDGSSVLYSTTFAGSGSEYVSALAIDATGAAYVFGQTTSPDFPVTPGALQTTLPLGTTQGFVAKIAPQGKVVYATLIGGIYGNSTDIIPISGGLLVDSAGEVFVSGQSEGGTFPVTSGAPYKGAGPDPYFILKLDNTGSEILAAIKGIGGSLASDSEGNIYIAGIDQGYGAPITPGAFQSTYTLQACGGDAQVGVACAYQYVTKLNASLTRIVYSTYVTGSEGATPSAIAVDAQGDVLLAGTTYSPDYPTTSDAFEPTYIANGPPPQTCVGFWAPASGYFTELNPTGTGLIYSTFFSGTQCDTISFAAFTSQGTYLVGQAGSPDLPGLEGVPSQCLPETFAAFLNPGLNSGASSITASHVIPGVASGSAVAYAPATNTLLAWTGSALISFDPAVPALPIACILDAADLMPVSVIAPGELLSIFGAHLFAGEGTPRPGSFPTTLFGVTVTFNGVAGPLLYVSAQQINVQAPYEIAGSSQSELVLTSSLPGLSDTRTLGVVASNPVAFLDTVTPHDSVSFEECPLSGGAYDGGPLPLAFNSDGSRNTCSNPASPGSVVTIFLDGLGVTVPPPVTGSINPTPGIPLNLPITANLDIKVVSAIAAPGSISGVWQVGLQVYADDYGAFGLSLSVGSVPVRDANLTIWVR